MVKMTKLQIKHQLKERKLTKRQPKKLKIKSKKIAKYIKNLNMISKFFYKKINAIKINKQ